MFYSIRHSTKFRYSEPVRQSVMEVRMQPRSELSQIVRQFELNTEPRSRVFPHRDFLGNIVHHFDIPGAHTQLNVVAESLVEVGEPAPLPESLPESSWRELEEAIRTEDFWDFLMPSRFCHSTPALKEFQKELGFERNADLLTLVRRLNSQMFQSFNYVQSYTNVDSPIDVALKARQGVCQDFTHIMVSMLRAVGIPSRYVSGYLYHRSDTHDRSVADATHAWVEAYIPGYGWYGFDPTNDLLVSNRHIRTAIGRDYSDATPTRGVFKGRATTEMKVAVHVNPADAPRPEELEPLYSAPWITIADYLSMDDGFEEMAHQQQQ